MNTIIHLRNYWGFYYLTLLIITIVTVTIYMISYGDFNY
jgi:hypothetical protein